MAAQISLGQLQGDFHFSFILKVPDRDCLTAEWEKMEKAPHMIPLEMPAMTKRTTAWIEPVTREQERANGIKRYFCGTQSRNSKWE